MSRCRYLSTSLILTVLVICAVNVSCSEAVTPGTRVVPATLPNTAPAKTETSAGASTQGTAVLSKYVTPGIENTLQESAAQIWVYGILGGERSYAARAPELFPNNRDIAAARFITLREMLYTASTWATGQARITKIHSAPSFAEVSFVMPNLADYIDKNTEELAGRYKIEKGTAKILAEWSVTNKIYGADKDKFLAELEQADTIRKVPVDSNGRISLNQEAMDQLLAAPEMEAIKAISAVGKYNIEWAKSYIRNIAAIVQYSTSISFSADLEEALQPYGK